MKPGDRVTSPLLVGEWVIDDNQSGSKPAFEWVWVRKGDDRIAEFVPRLTLVAPPIPPEPPVGSVVFVEGVFYRHQRKGWVSENGALTDWPYIAARAVPAVDPTNDDHLKAAGLCRVAEAIDWLDGEAISSSYYLGRFQAKFGGAS